MTLKEIFSDIRLNDDQNQLINSLEEYFLSDTPVFLMKGYAGTGKTFIIKGLAGYLQTVGRSVVLLAPTGRAAQILTEKTGFAATTIHRMLYAGERLDDTAEYKGKQYDVFKSFYGMGSNTFPSNTVFIVDEASMVSNTYSENDLLKFGSGYLLNDLVNYIWPHPADSHCKLIFSGDQAQLPPVDMNFSPALDASYLLKKFQLKCSEYELTEVVRQLAGGLVLQNATRIRNAVRNSRFGSLRLTPGHDVEMIDENQVVDKFIRKAGDAMDQAVVIAYSNRSVYKYNIAIRQQYFPGIQEPVAGDRLVVVHNNYLYERELLNGEPGTLIWVDNHHVHEHKVHIRLPGMVKVDQDEKEVSLRFREAVIQFTDTSGDFQIRCMILDNVLFSGNRDLTYNESVAMLVDFKQRWSQANMGNNEDFRTALRADPFFNALRVKFGYALTCHKSQGGEWKNVIVQCSIHLNYNTESYFRWLYTAITRAKEHLMLVNAPAFEETLLMKEAGNTGQVTEPDIAGVQSADPVEISKRAVALTGNHLLDLRAKIEAQLADTGITIANIESHDYHEIYHFEKKLKYAAVKFYYNKKQQFTRYQVIPVQSNGLEDIVIPILKMMEL